MLFLLITGADSGSGNMPGPGFKPMQFLAQAREMSYCRSQLQLNLRLLIPGGKALLPEFVSLAMGPLCVDRPIRDVNPCL